MFVLAILLHVPGIRICIFSTGKRASSAIMTEILDRLKHVEGGMDRLVKSNQEQLFIGAGAAKGGVRTVGQLNDVANSRLYSFPGTHRAARVARVRRRISRRSSRVLVRLCVHLY